VAPYRRTGIEYEKSVIMGTRNDEIPAEKPLRLDDLKLVAPVVRKTATGRVNHLNR
jgi:hypothetical protein